MPANECIPFKEEADRVTATASAAVTGKRFVTITGDRNADGTYTVGPAAAGAKAFGVACWDAAVGQRVTVIIVDSAFVVPVRTAAAVVANASVTSDATGQAITAAGGTSALGIVLSGAAAGADAQILLTRHTA